MEFEQTSSNWVAMNCIMISSGTYLWN